ncbi:hypothetical protein [Sphingopyxis sp. PET50]|uniref:hypothetical protein n=1 Tax=Sphingopyxis sp. PET50 TaxID=2976533 RepID=UPI0028B17393|nr:hypothetical protein [Sphingopyxis sp. PET50]
MDRDDRSLGRSWSRAIIRPIIIGRMMAAAAAVESRASLISAMMTGAMIWPVSRIDT